MRSSRPSPGPAGWDRVVGFSKRQWAVNRAAIYKRYLAAIPHLAAVQDVGTTEDSSFSMEAVLSLRPDLVILPEWSFGPLGPQVRQLEALGIPVLVIDYNAELPERHVAGTLAMGAATGNEERARALAALYMDKIADIARRVGGVTARPKVYLELGMGGADVVGNTYWKGMWGRLLDRVGAENIAAGRIPGAYAPLSPEYVLAANPDAVFIAGSSWLGQPRAVLTGFDADEATTRGGYYPMCSARAGRTSPQSARARCSRSSMGCAARCSTTAPPISSPRRSIPRRSPTSTRWPSCAATMNSSCLCRSTAPGWHG